MKRFIALMLALISVFTFSISAFAIGEGTIEPKVGGSGIAYTEFPVGEKVLLASNQFIGWHPDVSLPQQDVAYWYFRDATYSFSMYIEGTAFWKAFTATVGINFTATSSSADMMIRGNAYGWSRPCIRGDIYKYTVEAGYYNFNTNHWASEPTIKTYTKVEDTTIGIERASTKAALMG